MFNKGSINFITKDLINSFVTQEEVLSHYFNIKSYDKLICSPLRADSNPSFKVYKALSGDISFYDFGSRDYGDVFKMISIKYNMNYQEVLESVYKELILGKRVKKRVKPQTIKSERLKSERNKIIRIELRKVEDYDIEYWESQGVYNFHRFNIFPISLFEIVDLKSKTTKAFKANKYAYAYYENKDNQGSFKIYQPYSKLKWISNHDNSVWDLWTMLPEKGDNLIIASSRKDAANILSNFSIPTTALQGEGFLPKRQVVEELKQRFKNIYVFYDNDFDKPKNNGIIYANNLCDAFKLKKLIIPDHYKSKDPSDLFKNHGKTIYRQVMIELFNLNNIHFKFKIQ